MRRLIVPVLSLALTVGALSAAAQFRGRSPATAAMPEERTGFTFCRLRYTEVASEYMGEGWRTDYPGADQNLMIRLSELTKTRVTWRGEGDPAHAIVSLTDPELFACPFLFGSDVGTAGLNGEEVERLREYLLKGGFLWVDDFWGPTAWLRWAGEMMRVMPDAQIVELEMDHPIFSTFYFVEEVPQIPAIQFWRSSGGAISERGSQSAVPHISALVDADGRVLVLMSHNTDIADGWEREGEDYDFFHLFSPRGYAVGINVAIWSMTH